MSCNRKLAFLQSLNCLKVKLYYQILIDFFPCFIIEHKQLPDLFPHRLGLTWSLLHPRDLVFFQCMNMTFSVKFEFWTFLCFLNFCRLNCHITDFSFATSNFHVVANVTHCSFGGTFFVK